MEAENLHQFKLRIDDMKEGTAAEIQIVEQLMSSAYPDMCRCSYKECKSSYHIVMATDYKLITNSWIKYEYEWGFFSEKGLSCFIYV